MKALRLALFALLCLAQPAWATTVVIQSGVTWSTPGGVTTVTTAECIGAGAGGGSTGVADGGGGGAGYALTNNIPVSGSVTIQIGQTTAVNTNGTATFFKTSGTCQGGGGLTGTLAAGGAGGTGTGDVTFTGGAGSFVAVSGGFGGGGAGANGNGGAGTGSKGGQGDNGTGGVGGNAGQLGGNGTEMAAGLAGAGGGGGAPDGGGGTAKAGGLSGGGGGGNNAAGDGAGQGGQGVIVLNYTVNTSVPSSLLRGVGELSPDQIPENDNRDLLQVAAQ